jgi:hypothetical protein
MKTSQGRKEEFLKREVKMENGKKTDIRNQG